MKYFKLFPNAKFDFDKKGGCIINLFNYSIINLNIIQVTKLKYLLENPIEDFECLDFIEQEIILQITQKGMGYLYKSNIYNEEYQEKRGTEIRGLAENAPLLEKVYIQTTSSCSGKCNFCMNDSKIIYSGCNSCINWKSNKKNAISLSNTRWQEIIVRIMGLLVKTIVFSGGNPFMNWSLTKELIEIIRKNSNSIEIQMILNGSHLNSEILNYCFEKNIKLVFTVLGYNESSYTKITGNRLLYADLMNAVESCIEKKIAYQTTILAESSDLLSIKKFITENKWSLSSISEIGAVNVPFQSVKCYNERINNNAQNYRRNQKYNSCLYGKLAINRFGHMKACPMIEEVLADLSSEDISVPFQSLLIDKYWRMTKEHVATCSECPYRFSCEDCTVVELAINSKKIDGASICSRME